LISLRFREEGTNSAQIAQNYYSTSWKVGFTKTLRTNLGTSYFKQPSWEHWSSL